MKEVFDIVQSNTLFDGIILSDFENMISCLSPIRKKFAKSEVILKTGDRVGYIYIVLAGSVKIVKENIDGKENIIAVASVSEIFGEVFSCANILRSPVTVVALEDSEVLFLDYQKTITSCASSCIYHSKLIANMLKIIADKNIMLHQKIEIVSKRTTRERLLLYFDMKRGRHQKFTVPETRENLAAYLCVDRSAMSNELSKMQKEGIIKYNKNEIELL